MIALKNGHLHVRIAERGAELRSLQTADGAEFLWQGDAASWHASAPLLFPVVGRSPGNSVTINGVAYPMPPHGFAREQIFAVRESAPDRLTLTLESDARSRKSYPFDFALALQFRLAGPDLHVSATLHNHGPFAMPAQFGFHPGFNWPLPGQEGIAHEIRLLHGREPLLHRLDENKLLRQAPAASPFRRGRLSLQPDLFADDAMIFLGDQGNRVSLVARTTSLSIATTNMPHLGLWQVPGAPFICIEPWHGTAPFADKSLDLEDRHGAISVAAGTSVRFAMTLTINHAQKRVRPPAAPLLV